MNKSSPMTKITLGCVISVASLLAACGQKDEWNVEEKKQVACQVDPKVATSAAKDKDCKPTTSASHSGGGHSTSFMPWFFPSSTASSVHNQSSLHGSESHTGSSTKSSPTVSRSGFGGSGAHASSGGG